jgi:plastocyanin
MKPLFSLRSLVAVAALACTAMACTDEAAEPTPTPSSVPAPAVCKIDADCPTAADPCMTSACSAGVCGAKAKAEGAACNDDNVCNGTAEKCSAGKCLGTAIAKVCDDSNACTSDTCDPKVGCVFLTLASKCDDNKACTADKCDPATGKCSNTSLEGQPCDDGNQCTEGDTCATGNCSAGKAKGCDDANPCTTDSCDPKWGCVGQNNTANCSDNNACTKGDECLDGECRSGAIAVSCDDANPCTTDLCDPKSGCVSTPLAEGKPCSDGNACTNGDACTGAKCKAGPALDCNDGNACTSDVCDPKVGCQLANSATSCEDGNFCTANDVCDKGVCKPGSGAPDCNDGNPCTDDACDAAKGCVHTPNTAPCDDGNASTSGDKCAGSVCKGTPVAPQPKTVAVKTNPSNKFVPDAVDIAVGDSIEFTTGSSHDVVEVSKTTWDANGNTPLAGGFSVGFGATKTVLFDKAGTYYFVCTPHAGMGMKGTITVK